MTPSRTPRDAPQSSPASSPGGRERRAPSTSPGTPSRRSSSRPAATPAGRAPDPQAARTRRPRPRRRRHRPRRGPGDDHSRRRPAGQEPQSLHRATARGRLHRAPRGLRATVNQGDVIGRVNGLAVMGEDSGIVLPVMAEVAPSQGPGQVIATGQLKGDGRRGRPERLGDHQRSSPTRTSRREDIHIQFVQAGEGGVDGDSASITVATAVIPAPWRTSRSNSTSP